MYFLEWIDCQGTERSYRADSWIERDVIIEELEGFKYKYTVTVL